jgi:hypothetical protein
MTAVGCWSWFVVWQFLLGALPLEKGALSLSLSWLSIGSSAASGIILFVKGYGGWGLLHAYSWVQ